jgi:hypothetical protein
VRKAALFTLLMPLTFAEIYSFTAFLPSHWQRAINDHVSDILPKSADWTPVTHPLLNQEIEQVLLDHVGIRIALYVVTTALLIGNALLIRSIWRLLRTVQNTAESK